jgi:predicted nucleotidyltransferase
MTREEAIAKIGKIVTKANEYGDSERLSEIYIFGSFSRGIKNPHDCDILLIFDSDKNIIHTKQENILRSKFGGRISKIDMILCSTHDFNNYYPFVFKKETLIKIWEKNNKKDWEKIINTLRIAESEKDYVKPIQAKLFKMYPETLKRIEYAYSKNLLQIKEVTPLEYLNIKEAWINKGFYIDEDGHEIEEEFDEFEILTEYLSRLEQNKLNKSYIRTLKLMYIYAYKNDYCFSEYYDEHVKRVGEYKTHFYTEDKKILFIIYNPNFENVFSHLRSEKTLRKVIVIPWIRVNSKENFIYEIKRGKNWRKTYLERLDKIH